MNLLLHFGEIFRDSVIGTSTAIAGFYTTAIFLLTNQVTWIGVVIAVKYFSRVIINLLLGIIFWNGVLSKIIMFDNFRRCRYYAHSWLYITILCSGSETSESSLIYLWWCCCCGQFFCDSRLSTENIFQIELISQ